MSERVGQCSPHVRPRTHERTHTRKRLRVSWLKTAVAETSTKRTTRGVKWPRENARDFFAFRIARSRLPRSAKCTAIITAIIMLDKRASDSPRAHTYTHTHIHTRSAGKTRRADLGVES